jgi:hypothetical protein
MQPNAFTKSGNLAYLAYRPKLKAYNVNRPFERRDRVFETGSEYERVLALPMW